MDPNLAPPAPPPLQPVTPSNNPYEFITQAPVGKKRLLSGGGSKKQRILIVAICASVLLIAGVVIFGLISGGNKGPQTDYVSLVQQQAELIRISDVGIKQARESSTKNLAVTTKLTLLSEQPAVIKLAKKSGAQTDAKSILLGKNSQTDKLLTNASQTNQFDEVFTKTLRTSLKQYQVTLKKIHDQSTTKLTKDILAKDYTNAGILVADQKQ